MNEEEKKAIKMLNEMRTWDNYCYPNKEVVENIEIALNFIDKCKSNVKAKNERLLEYAEEIEKKDKIIDLMAKDIKEADKFLDSMGYLGEYVGYTIEDIIEEYKKEAEYKIKEDK